MRARQRRADFGGAERRDVDDLELRRRVAQQPVRARDVAAGQHEPVAARRERADQVAQHACAARGSSRTCAARGTRRAGTSPASSRARAPCRGTRAPRRTRRARPAALAGCPYGVRRERRRLAQRLQEPLGRRRDPLDVHVLRLVAPDQVAQPQQQRRAAAAAAAEDDGNPRARPGRSVEGREHAALERRALGDHHRRVSPASACRFRSLALWRWRRDSPASAWRTTPLPGSQVRTRCSFSSASRVPSATITMPACSE